MQEPFDKCQIIPIDQFRPNKSNRAIIGCPDFDPRTGLPGTGSAISCFRQSYVKCSVATNNVADKIERSCSSKDKIFILLPLRVYNLNYLKPVASLNFVAFTILGKMVTR